MHVLLTGHRGFLGSILQDVLRSRGHQVTGWDLGYFLPEEDGKARDVRDTAQESLIGFDTIVHLAALCNDSCGALDSNATHEINAQASIHLARTAKAMGVERFVFASSCSVYGAAETDDLDESAPVQPLTAYAYSKVAAETAILDMADGRFCPVGLRFATLYGLSPSFRSDLMVNRLVSCAWRWDAISISGDGSAHRPLLHVRDAALAIAEAVEADGRLVQGEAFNVGRPGHNFRIRDVADLVHQWFPDIKERSVGHNDKRSYTVRFDKFAERFPGWRPTMDIAKAVVELKRALDTGTVEGQAEWQDEWGRSDRSRWLQRLLAEQRVSSSFRWVQPAVRGSLSL